MKKLVYWLPRIITIVFILFLGIFALDVFESNYSFWKALIAFLIHLIPNFILLLILIISWRREWIATLLYILLGLFYIYWAWGRFNIWAYVSISGPLFLVGILFYFSWKQREK